MLSLTLLCIAGVDAFHEETDSFENFFRSIYSLFAMITFEDWPEVLLTSFPLVPTRVLSPRPSHRARVRAREMLIKVHCRCMACSERNGKT